MIIFLLGFMGSGKTTLGKRLARKIGYEFVDMDQYIEEKQGLSVADIFKQKGEAFFREQETGFIASLDKKGDLVVATGGGAPCFEQNMQLMKNTGITVYLKLSPVSLANRLVKARHTRPLIADMQPEQLVGYIESKLSERGPYYNQATCIIKGENIKPDHIIALVFGDETTDGE